MLNVSVPIAHELLAQYVNQGHALVQRASLVGDFSDYESWKSARKQWIEPTLQGLEHTYAGDGEADDFKKLVTPIESGQRWQQQYGTDLECVKAAIGFLSTLQGELAFAGSGSPRATASDSADLANAANGAPQPSLLAELPAGASAPPNDATEMPGSEAPAGSPTEPPTVEHRMPDTPFAPTAPNPSQQPPAQAPGTVPAQAPAVAPTLAPEPLVAERHENGLAPALARAREAPVGAELEPAQPVSPEVSRAGAGNEVETAGVGSLGPVPAGTKEVLLAHGRNDRWKQAVIELLETAGSHEVTILNERAHDRPRITERVDGSADGSRYAIVLLTADDVGAPRTESEGEPYFAPRARQGVVFEMGFLVAALTPGGVCVLYEDGVELPCDLEGIAYVRLDLAGTWQPKLLLHLRKAGFDYDLNKLAPV